MLSPRAKAHFGVGYSPRVSANNGVWPVAVVVEETRRSQRIRPIRDGVASDIPPAISRSLVCLLHPQGAAAVPWEWAVRPPRPAPPVAVPVPPVVAPAPRARVIGVVGRRLTLDSVSVVRTPAPVAGGLAQRGVVGGVSDVAMSPPVGSACAVPVEACGGSFVGVATPQAIENPTDEEIILMFSALRRRRLTH